MAKKVALQCHKCRGLRHLRSQKIFTSSLWDVGHSRASMRHHWRASPERARSHLPRSLL
jgi:hypothetical protein